MVSKVNRPIALLGRIVDQDKEHCQLVHNNVFLTYSVGQATRSNITSLVGNLERFFASIPLDQMAAYVLVTRGRARPPAAESRRAVEQVFARHGARLGALAVVVEVPGFPGAALRAVASTLFQLAKRKLPVRFFASAPECVQWVSESVNAPGDRLLKLLAQGEQLVGR